MFLNVMICTQRGLNVICGDYVPYELDMLLFIPLHSSVIDVRRVGTNLIFFHFLIRTDGVVLFISFSNLKFIPFLIGNYHKLPEKGLLGAFFCFFLKTKTKFKCCPLSKPVYAHFTILLPFDTTLE